MSSQIRIAGNGPVAHAIDCVPVPEINTSKNVAGDSGLEVNRCRTSAPQVPDGRPHCDAHLDECAPGINCVIPHPCTGKVAIRGCEIHQVNSAKESLGGANDRVVLND